MAEPRLISPMLDGFMMGSPISEHHGICCCPAMKNETDEKYIVKVISLPATPSQLDALLLSGAYSDEDAALRYFKEQADGVLQEVDILEKLAEVEGFIPYTNCQIVPMESGKGYEIYLLSSYKRSLLKHFKRHSFTHLDALNLGLDLCAVLSVSRRNGYLFVDLKPSNIFVTDQRLFRVGDLGFVRLDSLKYASIPEKYLSVYTPPEIRDAFSSLNPTMDTYAIGLILYQTYNNGELPFNEEIQPGDPLPAPLYADYEMSEIILKACDPNPDMRWQDPMQMGQAIVSYMQRNGAVDTPIVPMPTQEELATLLQDAETEAAEAADADTPTDAEAQNESAEPEETEEPAEAADLEESVLLSEDCSEEAIDAADDATAVSDEIDEIAEVMDLIQQDADDAPALEELDESDASYDTITSEVSDILNQADELAAIDVPEPVVAPDYVEVELPAAEEPETTIEDEDVLPPAKEEEKLTQESEDTTNEEYTDEFEDDSQSHTVQKNHHWLRNGLLVLTAILLLVGGFLFYKNFYLLPIEFITVEGSKDSLTVLVTTDIDETLLEVVCSDTYGNKIPAPVINGKAEFTGLVPNMAYNIKVVAKGFHRLTGSASTAYSTPIQTNIVQFDAVSGSTEDSVILSFTIKGPNCDEWAVDYSAEGEEVRTATFADAHMVTLTGLTVGKEYTFTLNPKQSLYLAGQSEITFTPRKLIRAENLIATGFTGNTLSVKWSAPEDESVSGWSVRCHNDSYSQTLVTTDTSAVFEGVDPVAGYDIEVKAAGMSVSEKINVPANSVTVHNFNINTSDPSALTLTWDPSKPIPEDGWVLHYSIAGIGNDDTVPCSENKAVISSIIPNATYRFYLADTKGTVLLGSQAEITTGNAVEFKEELGGVTIAKSNLTFAMCKTPGRPNWGRYDLSDDDYTTQFSAGTPASFLVRMNRSAYTSSKDITTMFVIRNQSGTPILTAQETKPWTDMWASHNCKLEIPVLPTEAGTYTVEVYFNGGLANIQEFTII